MNPTEVSEAFQTCLAQSHLQVVLADRIDGQTVEIPLSIAAASDGFLPLFLIAADAEWQEATGVGLDVKLEQAESLLGYRVKEIGQSFDAVMMALVDAASPAARNGCLALHELPGFWESTIAMCKDAATCNAPAWRLALHRWQLQHQERQKAA